MSAKLIPPLGENYLNVQNFKKFFNRVELDVIRDQEIREELPLSESPKESCKTNLFFGFFFDGTKNNYTLAETSKTHSNVARLYDCFPGLSVKGVLPDSAEWENNKYLYSNFFRVYVPGVASPFTQVNDSGEGIDRDRGGAFGYKGEARIIWALIQSINNVHRYFLNHPLLSPEETKTVIDRLVLDRDRLALMKPRGYFAAKIPNEGVKAKTRIGFEKILKRLHSAVSNHWPNANGKAAKTDPSIVKKIFISTFGFSRGATQARAFTNWLMALCILDAHISKRGTGMTLGGFEVEFNFLGLFDTVASVGAGNTLGNTLYGKLFDGHGAWADAESSLRIPPGLRCVHLVAAHEIRRSFPLDSISVKQSLPDNTDEIVVPGVHSDLGCGYMPREQGRGIDADGGDMLSRIPLIYMYREARLAGVPLKLERANDSAKLRFILLPETLKAFNAYIATCKVKCGTLTAIMRDQNKKRMLWNKARRASGKTPIEATASFKRASTFDQNDLHSSNLEFEQEIKSFERWLAEKGKGFTPRLQAPGFDNDYEDEWEEIASWWHNEPTPGPEVLDFFDNYVHDSRAWFKLISGNPDNETELIVKLKRWSQRRQRTQAYNTKQDKEYVERRKIRKLTSDDDLANEELPPAPMLDGLTDNERRASEEFERTGKIPRMLTTGREPFDSLWMPARAGYLRYRKIYSGFDSVLISSVNRQTQDESAA